MKLGVSNVTLKQNDKVRNGSQKIHCKPKEKKKRKNKKKFFPSKTKTVLVTFYDARSIIHKEFFPAGQTITGQYYLVVLKRLMSRIRRILPEYRAESICVCYTTMHPVTPPMLSVDF
ncbi:hypothetical protein TNCV_1498581 [Trichonephila clavipes]|nr:hypothetical protein TNCV_1498581 [Trichonephila clavipes]